MYNLFHYNLFHSSSFLCLIFSQTVNCEEHIFQKCKQQIDSIVKENSSLQNKVRELGQELLKERASIVQMNTEKSETDQQLQVKNVGRCNLKNNEVST